VPMSFFGKRRRAANELFLDSILSQQDPLGSDVVGSPGEEIVALATAAVARLLVVKPEPSIF
jgi:hypothetical protein